MLYSYYNKYNGDNGPGSTIVIIVFFSIIIILYYYFNYPFSFFHFVILRPATDLIIVLIEHSLIPWVAALAMLLPSMLKVAESIPGWGSTDLYNARGIHGVLPMRVGVRSVNLIYRLWRHCL